MRHGLHLLPHSYPPMKTKNIITLYLFIALNAMAGTYNLRIINTSDYMMEIYLSITNSTDQFIPPKSERIVSTSETASPFDVSAVWLTKEGDYVGENFATTVYPISGAECDLWLTVNSGDIYSVMSNARTLANGISWITIVEYFVYGFAFVATIECAAMMRRMAGKIATQTGGEV